MDQDIVLERENREVDRMNRMSRRSSISKKETPVPSAPARPLLFLCQRRPETQNIWRRDLDYLFILSTRLPDARLLLQKEGRIWVCSIRTTMERAMPLPFLNKPHRRPPQRQATPQTKSEIPIAADGTVQRLFQQVQNAQHSEQTAWTKLAHYLSKQELKE